MKNSKKKTDMPELYIREYEEESCVDIIRLDPEEGERYKQYMSKECYKGYKESRWIIRAHNEGGYAATEVDLVDLLIWVKSEMPEVWEEI